MSAKMLKMVHLLHCLLKQAPVAGEAAWVSVLQYGEEAYSPTAFAVGDMSEAPSSAGFAKLSDDEINQIPADSSGYYYYRLSSTKSNELNTVFVRTKSVYRDTARAYGWAPYSICNQATKEACDVHSDWQDISGDGFDTQAVYGDGCGRWSVDESAAVQCAATGSSSLRCFTDGGACERSMRKQVCLYKCPMPLIHAFHPPPPSRCSSPSIPTAGTPLPPHLLSS